MMVLYHLVFDLNLTGVQSFNLSSGFWFSLARTSASIFLLLVGISLSLSHSRAVASGRRDGFGLHLVKRSLWIFGLAVGITLTTYLLIGEGFVVFGVLHLISISLLLAYPFLRVSSPYTIPVSVLFGLACVIAGLLLADTCAHHPWLLWLGLAPCGFYSFDYFPVLPWFGVVLIGAALGELLFGGYRRRIKLPDLSNSYPIRGLSLLGRHSLAIYLAHQPAIFALLLLGGASLPGTR